MRERLVALGLVVGSLLLFYALFVPKPAAPSAQSTLPTSIDDGPDGLATAWRWLSLAGIPVVSLRARYDQLDHALPAGADRGNVLITSVPQRLPMREREWAPLQHWIERGNTLVVLAALDDTPQWAQGADPDYLTTLVRLTHIRFAAPGVGTAGVEAGAGARAGSRPGVGGRPGARAARSLGPLLSGLTPPTLLLEPRGRHPLLAGVHGLRVVSDLSADRWIGQPLADTTALAIAQRTDSGARAGDDAHAGDGVRSDEGVRSDDDDAVIWLEPERAGQLIVCAFAGAFSNRQIGQADNARLLANIVAWSRASAGRVIFDDTHQGLVAFYDPQAFFGDPRLHRTLWWIVLLWLVWALGSQTLRSWQPTWRPVDETALIGASGRFYSARVPQREAARRLLSNFFNDLRRQLRLPEDGAPLWDWLAGRPGVSAAQCLQLRDLHARAQADATVSLVRLQNLLSQLRGRLG